MVKQFLRLIIFSSLTLACFCSCKDEPAVTESLAFTTGSVLTDTAAGNIGAFFATSAITDFASQIGLGSFFGASGGDSGALKKISNQLNILTNDVNKLIDGQAIIEGQISNLAADMQKEYIAETDDIQFGNMATHCSSQINSLKNTLGNIQDIFTALQFFLEDTNSSFNYAAFYTALNTNSYLYSLNNIKSTLVSETNSLFSLNPGLLNSCIGVIIKSGNGYPFLTGSAVHETVKNLVDYYAEYQYAAAILSIWKYTLPNPSNSLTPSEVDVSNVKKYFQDKVQINLPSQYSMIPPPIPENHFADVRTNLLWHPYVDKKSTENKVAYTYAEIAPLLNFQQSKLPFEIQKVNPETRINQTSAWLGLPSPTISTDPNYAQYYDLPLKSDWESLTSRYVSSGSNSTTLQKWLVEKTNNVWPTSYNYPQSSIWLQDFYELLAPYSDYYYITDFINVTSYNAAADLLISGYASLKDNSILPAICLGNGPLASSPLAQVEGENSTAGYTYTQRYYQCTGNSGCTNPTSCENRPNCILDLTNYAQSTPTFTVNFPADGHFIGCTIPNGNTPPRFTTKWPRMPYASVVFKKMGSYNYSNLFSPFVQTL